MYMLSTNAIITNCDISVHVSWVTEPKNKNSKKISIIVGVYILNAAFFLNTETWITFFYMTVYNFCIFFNFWLIVDLKFKFFLATL